MRDEHGMMSEEEAMAEAGKMQEAMKENPKLTYSDAEIESSEEMDNLTEAKEFSAEYPDDPPSSLISSEIGETSSFLEFAKNEFVMQYLWGMLEAQRVRREQALERIKVEDPEIYEKSKVSEEKNINADREYFERVLKGVSEEEIKDDNKFNMWFMHYMKSVGRRLFIQPQNADDANKFIKNPEILEIANNSKNTEELIERVFDRTWRTEQFKGEPKQQPRNSYWPSADIA